MKQYSYQNHFKFSWESEWFHEPPQNRGPLRLSYGQVKNPVRSFREECVRAAKLIAEDTNETLLVALSGGIDSEVIARSFLEAQIPFKAVTLRFAGGINEKDISYASAFCREYGIDHIFIDIDVAKFWERDIFNYVEKYGVTSTHRPLMMRLLEQVDGYTLMGGGDIRLKRDSGSEIPYFTQSYDSTILQRFLMHRSQAGCPRFFMYTPELIQSFLEDPLIQGWMQCAKAMRMLTIKNFKPLVFHRLWPEMRPRQKLHGFELLEAIDMNLRERLQKLATYDPKRDEIRIRPDEMLRALSGKEPATFLAGREIGLG